MKLGVHWRVKLSRTAPESISQKWILFWELLSERIGQLSESRPAPKWTQYYTARGELLLEFETVSKSWEHFSREQNNKKVWSKSEIIELIFF